MDCSVGIVYAMDSAGMFQQDESSLIAHLYQWIKKGATLARMLNISHLPIVYVISSIKLMNESRISFQLTRKLNHGISKTCTVPRLARSGVRMSLLYVRQAASEREGERERDAPQWWVP